MQSITGYFAFGLIMSHSEKTHKLMSHLAGNNLPHRVDHFIAGNK